MELLCNKVLAFDEQTQQTLKVASCLGSPFSLITLKRVVNNKDAIESALSTGLIVQHNERSNTMYRFVHDQVQEAVFSLLPKNSTELFYYSKYLYFNGGIVQYYFI